MFADQTSIWDRMSDLIKSSFRLFNLYVHCTHKKNVRATYVSANELKILLLELAFEFVKLLTRDPSEMAIGEDVNGIGPPTSMGESALLLLGLSAEFCEVLIKIILILKLNTSIKNKLKVNFDILPKTRRWRTGTSRT